ncbi:MAG TPA: ROK family transcriptional regulator [Candidatus Cybelea sp.]|nr:ROK family transcriptional regulator [Candidatus Cybelea sp.]
MEPSRGIAGTNLEHARSHNRRVVLEAVRLHGPLSRADIARLTALTSQTVSNIVQELEDGGLLQAAAPRSGGRGQPATPLSIDPDGAYSIGIELDHHGLTAVLVDLAGQIRGRVGAEVRDPRPQSAIPQMVRAIRDLRTRSAVDWSRILGVGLAMPGPFNAAGRSLMGPTSLPGWDDPDGAAIARRIGLPVILENDAKAAAIGEHLHGAAKHLSSFAFIYLGMGLGAGLFLDGHVYKGAGRNAGEIGHMIVETDGRPCHCGNRGCLEQYVSLRAAYQALGIARYDRGTPEELVRRLDAGEPRIMAWLASTAAPLRRAINMLESLLDPETIVLGGVMPQPLLQRIADALPPLAVSAADQNDRATPRLVVGAAGPDTPALGAAALPIFDELNPQLNLLLKKTG